MASKFILSIDQGTTGSTVLVLDSRARVVGRAYSEFKQYYPKPGWVEHDAEEIWTITSKAIKAALQNAGVSARDLASIGITNQRETVVVWDKKTGKPIHKAIVWQCRRTAEICAQLKKDRKESKIRKRTGLVLDPYFSGTKLSWILSKVKGARAKAKAGKLLAGTIDTWLIWKLTGGAVHATDPTNASRTMLFDIHKRKWDSWLCETLDVPMAVLPEVRPSSGDFGVATQGFGGPVEVPICGVAGDQQAALYGQGCWDPGMAKNTYGTGCFMLLNTGDISVTSKSGLLTTLACGPRGEACYALEGSVFVAGAAIQWLRDELQIIEDAKLSEKMARKVKDTGGVYLVPAFVGLGAPYWDSEARGALVGLTRGTNRNHVVRAALEAMAYQTRDLAKAMENDSGVAMKELRVDGGACANNFLMEFQASVLGVEVDRPRMIETTALGAAFLAGIGCGFWKGPGQLAKVRKTQKRFQPKLKEKDVAALYKGWLKAVERVR